MDMLESSLHLPLWARELSAEELDGLLVRYGWFGPLRILHEVRTGRPDARAAVVAPWRAQSTLRQLPVDAEALTAEPCGTEFRMPEEVPEERAAVAWPGASASSEAPESAETPESAVSPDDRIDRFLQQTDLRIVAEAGEPETEVLTEASFDDDDEVVSERLAEIYLAQGLRDRAVSIYRKLSLRNPEKSIYFAGLITEIENNN